MESTEEKSTIELFKRSAPLIIPCIQSTLAELRPKHYSEILISNQSEEFSKANIYDHDVCFLVEDKIDESEMKDTIVKLKNSEMKVYQDHNTDLHFPQPATITNREAIALFTEITDHNFALKDCVQQTVEGCLIKEKIDSSLRHGSLSNAEFSLGNFLEENQEEHEEVINRNLLKQDEFLFLSTANHPNLVKDDGDLRQSEKIVEERNSFDLSTVDVLTEQQQEVINVCDIEENWIRLFCEYFDEKYSGYAKNLPNAEQVIKQYEHDTNSKFCVWNSPKNFGNTSLDSKIPRKIFFNEKKVPYLVLSSKRYSCEHGKDRHRFDKIRKRKKNNSQTTKDFKSITKKVDCAAVILLREVLIFPQLQINRNTHWERRIISTNIRTWLAKKSNENLSCLRYIHVCLPKVGDHTNHGDIEHREAIHPAIVEKVYDMIWENENIAVDSLREKINAYVAKRYSAINSCPSKRRRFSPSATDLKYMTTKAKRLSIVNNEDKRKTTELIGQLSKTKTSHKFYLCEQFTNVSDDSANTGRYSLQMKSRPSQILFIYQNVKAQALLYRYGEQVYFTKLSRSFVLVPYDVFCLHVGTNVDFQPVVLAICQNYSVDLLKCLFDHVRSWNKFWVPCTVFTERQLIADLSIIFQECTLYVSKASREREWLAWLEEFDAKSKEKIMALLQNIGDATTDELLCDALRKLEMTEEWKTSQHLAKYFTEHWLPCLQRWIYPQDLLCNKFRLHDETSCLNEFKIKPFTNSICTSWFPRLVENLITAMERCLTRYTELNERCDEENAVNEQNFSRHLLCLRLPVKQYINDKMNEAQSISFTHNAIEYGIYSVKDITTMKSFTVSFGCSETTPLSCDCAEWKGYHLPCLHMCYLFHHEDEWNFNRLPMYYRCNPFFTVDSESSHVNCSITGAVQTQNGSKKRRYNEDNKCVGTAEDGSLLKNKFSKKGDLR